MPYKLAPGWNNAAGFILLTEIIDGEPMDSHASSLGTFRAAREIPGLDGITRDDGEDVWEWKFASLTTTDIQTIEEDILDGERSNQVTVETRNRYGAWVTRNAVLTIPAILNRSDASPKFSAVIFSFTGGHATS